MKPARKFYIQVTHTPLSIAVFELIKGKESITSWLLYERSKSLFKKWNSAIHLNSNIHAKCSGYKRSPGSSLCASQYICIAPILSRRYYTEVTEPQNPKNTPNCVTARIFKPLQHLNSQFSRCLCSFVLYPLAHIMEISMSGI